MLARKTFTGLPVGKERERLEHALTDLGYGDVYDYDPKLGTLAQSGQEWLHIAPQAVIAVVYNTGRAVRLEVARGRIARNKWGASILPHERRRRETRTMDLP